MTQFYPTDDLNAPQPRPRPQVYPERVISVTNKTPRPKAFFPLVDGDHKRSIALEPGQTLSGVRVAEHVVEQLRRDDEFAVVESPQRSGDVVKAV
jgi:hypothetical protein